MALPIFSLGIDVAKLKLDCCLLSPDCKRKNKVVDNSESGILDLCAWLNKNGIENFAQIHAVMEGTGVYHDMAAHTLAEANLIVSVVNPALVKKFGQGLGVRTKTDRMDSYVLARYCEVNKPIAWQAPTAEARELQALRVRLEAISEDLRREQNRAEKTAFSKVPAYVHASINETITFLKSNQERLEKEITLHINAHPDLKRDLNLLKSIPAIGIKVGTAMLSVLHSHSFNSAEQLAAYLGVVPIERQSGTSISGRPRMSKCGPSKIRTLLYMASLTAIRNNPHIKTLYERLTNKGKSKMTALGAAMRKLAHICFGVIKNQKSYEHSIVA